MKTILPKNHRYKNYVGKNGIEIVDLPCLDYACFQPYNFTYVSANAELKHNWYCSYRENNGCPEHPKKEK